MWKILIVDDHAITRRGVREILTQSFKIERIAEAVNAAQAFDLISQLEWDLVLVDISMPGESGISLLRRLKESHPRLPVLVLSFHNPAQVAPLVLKLGASGYLSKESTAEELAEAVDLVLQGGIYVGQQVVDSLLNLDGKQPQLEKLSRREFEIFNRIASGKGISEIAEELGLSVKTVCTYRGRMMMKMRMHTSAELIRYAFNTGFLEMGPAPQ